MTFFIIAGIIIFLTLSLLLSFYISNMLENKYNIDLFISFLVIELLFIVIGLIILGILETFNI